MKITFLSLLAGLIGVAQATPEHKLTEWSVGKTLYGAEVNLDNLSGQADVISYWSAGAQEDEKSLEILRAAHRKFQSKGLVVIAA